MAIGSMLKGVIKELPESFSMKAESVAPMLLKKGVKAEELEFSGVNLHTSGKVTKEQLVDAESKRTDNFYSIKIDEPGYQSINLSGGKNNPTYREKVLKFRRQGEELDSRYTSSHFPEEENYLMHTRVYDETMGGAETRVVAEIQSDLHQAGRQTGYEGDRDQTPLNTREQELVDNAHTVQQLLDEDDDVVMETFGVTAQQLRGEYDTLVNRIDFGEESELGYLSEEEILQAIPDVMSSQGIPKSPYEKTWLRKGIERELSDAVDEGRAQLAIPISGKVGELSRAPGVQKWYETQVVNTAKKVAKQSGGIFELKTVNDVTYATIKPKGKIIIPEVEETNSKLLELAQRINSEGVSKEITDEITKVSKKGKAGVFNIDKGLDFKLYSSPIAGSFVAYQAYQAGMTQEQVNNKLVNDYGYDAEDIEEVNKRVDIITQAQAAGMSIEDIKSKMEGREPTADTVESKPAFRSVRDEKPSGRFRSNSPKKVKLDKLVDDTAQMTAEELVSSMKVIYPTMVSDTITTIPAYFGNKGAQQRYDQARDASRNRIISLAKEDYNLDLLWQPNGVGDEGWFAQTPEGLVEVTPGFWEDFKKVSGEIGGGIAGAIAGGKAAMVATPPILPGVGPLAKPLAGIFGAAVGGWLGAASGSQLDYVIQATKLQEDFEGEAMAYKAFNAFEAAAIGEILGYPLIKGIGTSWSAIVRAKDAIVGGEAKAAYQSLKDTTFLTDDQITGIVTQLEKHAALSGNKYEKGIKAVALTEPGMQDLVRAAGASHPKASSATAHVVQSRAEDVLTQTARLTDEQVPRMLSVDLQNYVGDVRDQYARVKAKATQSPKGLNFEWDFEELAVKPVMEKLKGKITDPATRDKFLLQMRKVNTMSESRNYGDLIELRQMVNDFLYNKRITKADDKSMLRGVISNIDNAIEDGASSVLEQPEKWLKDWSNARVEYSKMKQVEKTAMYRAIFNKDGSMRAVQPETVIKALGRHITSIDGSFEEIMTKLPIEGRKMYEGAVVDSLTQRFTAGIDKGSKAIHFPMLADELKKINFTTPAARTAKKALMELGETFKNDVWLSQTAGQVTIPKFQSYLTTDPVVRAKFEVASGIFNYIKSKAPGDANRQLALVRATSKLLEKPLDAQNFKTLQAEVFDDANLSKQVLELQQEAARNRMKEVEVSTPKVKIYSGGKLKGTGTSTTIPMHRIVTLQQAKEIAETEALTLDSKALDAVLKQYGYKAVLQGSDRVRILGEK